VLYGRLTLLLMASGRRGRGTSAVPSTEDLYRNNSLASFWQPEVEVPPGVWAVAAESAANMLPDGPTILAHRGWTGLMEHILGEGQFGEQRLSLTPAKRLYYQLKPFVPRRLTLVARRRYRTQQVRSFPLGWPVEPRYVQFMHLALEHAIRQLGYATPHTFAPQTGGSLRCRTFWPNGARYAFVLTHDVEAGVGYNALRRLADLDERYGFRASFNFVPGDYPVEAALMSELNARGFEVGVHGLKHDGRLFWSDAEFARQVTPINSYLSKWEAVGFRAPYVHRHARLMQALEIEYDTSYFDTDPFEPMSGGTMSIWPFLCGHFVELPYTLAQDHTLLVLLGQRTPQLWLDKVDFIAKWGGMVLLNVHPDYMLEPGHWAVYEAFLAEMAQRRSGVQIDAEVPTGPSGATYWHAVPREVARWWRTRTRAEGNDSALAN